MKNFMLYATVAVLASAAVVSTPVLANDDWEISRPGDPNREPGMDSCNTYVGKNGEWVAQTLMGCLEQSDFPFLFD